MNLTVIQVIAIFAAGFCLGAICRGEYLFWKSKKQRRLEDFFVARRLDAGTDGRLGLDHACGSLYGNLPGEKEGKEKAT